MWIQSCKNHDPQGWGGVTMARGRSFTKDYTELIFKESSSKEPFCQEK